jgi:hypothetical protein
MSLSDRWKSAQGKMLQGNSFAVDALWKRPVPYLLDGRVSRPQKE